MFLNNKSKCGVLAIILASAMTLQGCSTLFPTQRMIDDILPNNDRHYYCDADLIPYSKDELTNATLLYGQELSEYYFLNADKYDDAITQDYDEAEKEAFLSRLTYLNSNYKLLKDRYEKYAEENGSTKEDFQKVDAEFNDFYRLPNSKMADIIRETNGNRLAGSPEISIKIKNDTFKDNGIYVEAEAEIYKHVTIPKKQYAKMKIGDTITLDFPESNRDINNTNMRKVELTLIASDSLIEYNTHPENKVNDEKDILSTDSLINNSVEEIVDKLNTNKSKDSIYYVTPEDPLSNFRKLINADGEVIEVYAGNQTVELIKGARIATGIDETRLVTQILRDDPGTKNYSINQIVDAHKSGGFVFEEFKDDIYLNNIYTNLKGYVTSGYLYEQMYIDIEYARIHNTEYASEKKSNTSEEQGSREVSNEELERMMNGEDPQVVLNEDKTSENGVNENVSKNNTNENIVNESSINESSITESSESETNVEESSIEETSIEESVLNETSTNESLANE